MDLLGGSNIKYKQRPRGIGNIVKGFVRIFVQSPFRSLGRRGGEMPRKFSLACLTTPGVVPSRTKQKLPNKKAGYV